MVKDLEASSLSLSVHSSASSSSSSSSLSRYSRRSSRFKKATRHIEENRNESELEDQEAIGRDYIKVDQDRDPIIPRYYYNKKRDTKRDMVDVEADQHSLMSSRSRSSSSSSSYRKRY